MVAIMKLNIDDQADVRIQLSIALVGAITQSIRALRVRVTTSGILMLIAYFERPPLCYEKDILQDAVAEAAASLYRVTLEPETHCVVTQKQLIGLNKIDKFEEKKFGSAPFSFWIYAQHGEVPGDEDDLLNNLPLEKDQFFLY